MLRLETVDREPLGARQVRIRQTAIGVNFIDTYDRSGLYPVSLPSGLGREAAGVVLEAGKAVKTLREGDRVAYAGTIPGAYCDERVMDAARVVKLPESVSDREAAAIMLKGLTAWFLLRRCHRVRRNEPVLAARGGGRRRADRAAMGGGPRREGHRGRRQRREGGARRRARCGGGDRQLARERRRARARDHAEIAASRSSTTASARTRSSPRSTASRRSASW